MDKTGIDEIVSAVNGRLIRKCDEAYITGVKHDSRECAQGDMFVAIQGENNDGHRYIPQVIRAGCRTVMVSHTEGWYGEIGSEACNIIEVEDTVYAMGELAAYYLDKLDILKVAVTGSVGKTSTRDMIYYVLSEKYTCGRNMKNFNNAIGLPLSIFRFDSSTQAAVLEMGMNSFGEIDRLAGIVKPDIAVITNIGISHMENLGSREGIFRAKMEIAGHIKDRDGKKGTLVFPYDGEFLTKERTAGDYEQIMVGTDGKSDYIISDIKDSGMDGISFDLEHNEQIRHISIPVPGRHNAVNSTLAIAVGELLGVGIEDAQAGLAKAQLTGSRLRRLKNERLTVIDDTYNASPDSMKSALKVLEQSSCSGSKTAVLGDMFELGENTERRHYEVGLFARGLKIDKVIAVGRLAENIAHGAAGGSMQVMWFEKKEEMYDKLDQIAGTGDIILIKGSRGMKMEQIAEKILEI